MSSAKNPHVAPRFRLVFSQEVPRGCWRLCPARMRWNWLDLRCLDALNLGFCGDLVIQGFERILPKKIKILHAFTINKRNLTIETRDFDSNHQNPGFLPSTWRFNHKKWRLHLRTWGWLVCRYRTWGFDLNIWGLKWRLKNQQLYLPWIGLFCEWIIFWDVAIKCGLSLTGIYRGYPDVWWDILPISNTHQQYDIWICLKMPALIQCVAISMEKHRVSRLEASDFETNPRPLPRMAPFRETIRQEGGKHRGMARWSLLRYTWHMAGLFVNVYIYLSIYLYIYNIYIYNIYIYTHTYIYIYILHLIPFLFHDLLVWMVPFGEAKPLAGNESPEPDPNLSQLGFRSFLYVA